MTTVALLGSTGSIGTQAMEVVEAESDRFEIVALGANSSVEQLAQQANRVHPQVVALGDSSRAGELKELLPAGTELLAGPDAMAEAALAAEVAVNGVVGFAGLPVTLAVLGSGRR
ncbi:MAG: 1-deoxy-D-xylulose-5-phosphate reductoisomerase, partial [Microthrixaceae bacterium]|nr:1-deoxy-D-xylulose-5-phosphate reductoisomerase [Microthrixaceae bacterium]